MSTIALRRPRTFAVRPLGGVRVWEIGGVFALVALTLLLRTSRLGTGFWIDEGLSVGIASHPLTHIPGLLRQDGSPPLYYMLLHVWMAIGGHSVQWTHWLSVIFAQACIPLAFWAGATLFDRRVAWAFAFLTAINPFLTSYAQETRMYALLVVLAIPCVTCFLLAYVRRRRAWRWPFGALLAAMMWTHNWSLFLGAAFAIGLAVIYRATEPEDRRRLLRDGVTGFGLAAVLYAAWIPTLLYTSKHTGAPWADAPSARTLLRAPNMLLGGQSGSVVVLLVGGFGLAAVAERSLRDRRVVVPVLVILALTPIILGWISSQISPAWATRYLAVALAPLILAAAIGIERAGRLGIAGLALLTIIFLSDMPPTAKSNAHYVAKTSIGPELHRGDMIISTQPEQVPVLAYYMPKNLDLQWYDPFGKVPDTGITDWRDGDAHFDRTGVDTQLEPEIEHMRIGQQVVLIRPIIYHKDRWVAPWSSRVADRSSEYFGAMLGNPDLELVDIVPTNYGNPGPNPLQALLFRKYRNG